MDTVKTISAQLERLPLKLQEEVLHFVRYLVVRNRTETGEKERGKDTVRPRRSILELRRLGKRAEQGRAEGKEEEIEYA
ncbi:MAG: hypothetical protein D3916_08660 [Candidatus Electrothrix sp. MAN1_4]|nr:hypothetical protein [Candidatus Electrothrix sp. MAN1_4]